MKESVIERNKRLGVEGVKPLRNKEAELERESRAVLRRAALNMARLTYEGSAEALDRQFDYIRGIMQGRKVILKDMMGRA